MHIYGANLEWSQGGPHPILFY